MKPGTRTLALIGAVVVAVVLALDHLGSMSLRFFGTSTLAARATTTVHGVGRRCRRKLAVGMRPPR